MDKPVNKKPKLKKQEILPKRVGGIYEKSTNMKTLKRRLRQHAVAQTQQNQRKRKDKCKATERKVFRDIDKYTKIIQALLIEGRYKPRKLRRKEIYDGVRHKNE